jgi:hypothetical protein
VLFSRGEIANFINQAFEPVWESVRPVPLVRIDFGNGTVLTRTLNGNIATSVCSADGTVLDILPGIYTPAVYQNCLKQFNLLADYANQPERAVRTDLLRDYHKAQAAALEKNLPALQLVRLPPRGKAVIEKGPKLVLMPGKPVVGSATGKTANPIPRVASAEDLANWKALAEDTVINEKARRAVIHQRLAQTGLVEPRTMTKWLYKEVLHADLDDPYLGLGEVLFANYPFKDRVH